MKARRSITMPESSDQVPASTPVTNTAAPAARFLPAVPLGDLWESDLNPRKRFDQAALEELTASIREKGVLTPLLVRPCTDTGKSYEIAAGHRRYRAAKAAGLDAVPAVVRDMTDAEFLEVLVIENDQREDVHPLEEAAGYQALLSKAGYDVAKIAARVGRSPKYVYDRVKLLQLTPEAQKLFLADRFTAGHAILLARLDAATQAKAIDPEETRAVFTHEGGYLFDEPDLGEAAEDDPYYGLKAQSVREFQAWIDRHVKADREQADPMLFPETAALVSSALEAGEKIIPIMRLSQTPEAARGAERIYTESSWERADGEEGSKTCEHSEVGVVTIGPGRYDAFRICRKKDRCTVHWAKAIRERKARQKAAATAEASGKDPRKAERETYAEQERRRKEQQAREEADQARWKKATPAILEAVAAAVTKAPTHAGGELARLILARCKQNYHARNVRHETYLAKGRTGDDLVRFAAFVVLCDMLHEYRAPEEFPKRARAFGIDVRKIVDAVAPKDKARVERKAKVQTK
jgi:ParB/RepB/Spo0J family partition protein